MKIKSDISEMTITVPVKQFAHILSLATNYAEIVKHLKETEAKLVRMRGELISYQTKLTYNHKVINDLMRQIDVADEVNGALNDKFNKIESDSQSLSSEADL